MSVEPSTMNVNEIPEPLLSIMKGWFNPEVMGGNWAPTMLVNLQVRPGMAEQFRQQLAALICAEAIDPATYRAITTHELRNNEAINDHLRALWNSIYDDAPIPGDPHRYDDEAVE